jgi:hypothetical protein
METKHEPGPWAVNDQRASGWMNNAMYVGSENTGKIIARVYNDNGGEEANARLISAAPSLLEALETMLDCFVNDPLGWMDSSDIAIEKAYDAIHKVKGD